MRLGTPAWCGLAFLVGCGNGGSIDPPTIYYGQDVCAACGMIISDERFAAGLVVRTGDGLEHRMFDDLGCLLEDESSRPDEAVAARWVRDARAGMWLRAETATYVHSPHLHTPMAFGLAACDGPDSARALAADHPGDVLDFSAVRARFDSNELAVLPPEREVDS